MDGFGDLNRVNNDVEFVDLDLRLGLPAFHGNENRSLIGEFDLNLAPSSDCLLDQAMQHGSYGEGSGSNNTGHSINTGGYQGYNNYNYDYNHNYINNYYPSNVGAPGVFSQSGGYLVPNNNDRLQIINNANYNTGINIGRPAARHRSAKRARNEANKNEIEDPNRCCSNGDCKTFSTPMWRRGPLGPKTLCNACGIKWRKLQEKMEADAKHL